MVTVIIDKVDHSIECYPLEGVQFTIGEETEVTDAKGYCIFKNITPGRYDIRVFKEGFGSHVFPTREIKDTPDVQHFKYGFCENTFLKLSADKTKIKKNETVTIVAQLFKDGGFVANIRQVSFSINGTQKLISDFDTDKEIAVMTLKGSNQGKVQITAHTQYIGNYGHTLTADSNALFIQDGDGE